LVNKESNKSTLAKDSFDELRYIFDWSVANRDYTPSDVILIGGWAVHSFNPWKYSLDIDLIATGRFKRLLTKHLYSTRAYSKERDSAGNTLFLKRLESGDIYLDFLPKKDQFHGTGKLLDLTKIQYQTVSKKISYSSEPEFQVIVPDISFLLLLKLKAAWDRHYDLSLEPTIGNSHLREKFAKDCGDIIALLQSDEFRFARIDWFSSIMSRFDFLLDFLKQGKIGKNSTFDSVSHKEGNALINKLLSLI
jgi:hypothetical protein